MSQVRTGPAVDRYAKFCEAQENIEGTLVELEDMIEDLKDSMQGIRFELYEDAYVRPPEETND